MSSENKFMIILTVSFFSRFIPFLHFIVYLFVLFLFRLRNSRINFSILHIVYKRHSCCNSVVVTHDDILDRYSRSI